MPENAPTYDELKEAFYRMSDIGVQEVTVSPSQYLFWEELIRKNVTLYPATSPYEKIQTANFWGIIINIKEPTKC